MRFVALKSEAQLNVQVLHRVRDRLVGQRTEFDVHGLMRLRIASINDLPINESERKYHWQLGRRPDGHPGLSDLDL